MIDNRFQRVKPNKARKVPSTTLGCAMTIDYAALVAPMGGTQPLGLVRERIPLSVGLGSHTRQVGTAHKCARKGKLPRTRATAMCDWLKRTFTGNEVCRGVSLRSTLFLATDTRAKQKDHQVMVFLFWLRMLGNEDENNWVLFSPKFSTQSRKQVEFEENDGLRPYDCSGCEAGTSGRW